METTEFRKEIITRPIHVYKCDDCGEVIGKSEEAEDGYYIELGETKYHFRVGDEWYTSQKTLCERCQIKYRNKIMIALTELGFVEGY